MSHALPWLLRQVWCLHRVFLLAIMRPLFLCRTQVRDSEGNEVQFRIKKKTQLKKLMDAYCARMGTSVGTYRFLFDGNRVNDTDTPESLEMEDMDVIDAVLFQQGGIEAIASFTCAPVLCGC
ncbi:hypothetical protein I4F81_005124 [Pyropia yezoensis]|uniref:Uncharacterized protein n=1 Tax=Pyropia yezoensis TaxID=2788 RepID=A0ACC3BXY6_PYRYE|nr:hypothetical protein I4F81_005124 [Neopyropia yezoensis]